MELHRQGIVGSWYRILKETHVAAYGAEAFLDVN